jgi:hypothetical protein
MKTKWLLPILIIGLVVFGAGLPTWASDKVLADGPPITDKLQTQVEESGPLSLPPQLETLVEESTTGSSEAPGATAQLDDSTHGTY